MLKLPGLLDDYYCVFAYHCYCYLSFPLYLVTTLIVVVFAFVVRVSSIWGLNYRDNGETHGRYMGDEIHVERIGLWA